MPLLISVGGLFLIPIMLINPPQILSYSILTRQLVGGIFIGICGLGIIAAVSPRHCKPLPHGDTQKLKPSPRDAPPRTSSSRIRRGHHPNCPPYRTHVLQVGERIWCAGCTGLALGGIIGIVGGVSYFMVGFPLPVPPLLLAYGFVGVALGLSQHTFYRVFTIQNEWFRVLANTNFVGSVFLVLSAVDAIGQSALLEIYLLLLILYWIYARILRSHAEHALMCRICPDTSCVDHVDEPHL